MIRKILILVTTLVPVLAASCSAQDQEEPPLFSKTRLLSLVNQARVSGSYCGSTWYPPVKKVRWNERLEAAARIQAKDMLEHGQLTHTGSDGSTVGDRLIDQKYFWKACGENVAYGMLYEKEAIKEWLNSEGHCRNIMNAEYTEMGAWQSGLYWSQVFANPQGRNSAIR